MRGVRYIFLSLILLSFMGCEKRDVSELREVHWDRDMCERCKMVVSDRHHTIQLINTENGKSYMFDDIGCMVLWLKDEKIEWFSTAKVWITDASSGEWIDAKDANYKDGFVTPMAYGFSAHKTKESIKAGQEIIDYDEVVKRVIKIGK